MVKKRFFFVCLIVILITGLAYAKDEKKQAVTKIQIPAGQMNVLKTDFVVEKLVLRTDDAIAGQRTIFKAGQTLYADCHWKRNGLKPEHGISVVLYVDDVIIGSKKYWYPDLSGKTSVSWKMVTGEHDVKCVLKISDLGIDYVDDADPNNNQKVRRITVQKPLLKLSGGGFAKPDLKVTQVGVKVGEHVYYQPYKKIKKGATLEIVCDWKNNNSSIATDKDWLAQLAPSPYGIPKMYKIDKGINSGTVFSVPIKSTTIGFKKLKCWLDVSKKIQELNESNNYGSLMINIVN